MVMVMVSKVSNLTLVLGKTRLVAATKANSNNCVITWQQVLPE